MIQSSRYKNQRAWFSGDANGGDYYDQSTGQYLGSWSRKQGDFLHDSKVGENLFESVSWLNRGKKTQPPEPPESVGFLPGLIQSISSLASRYKEQPDPLRQPGRYIAFVGDSFCAHVDRDRFRQFYIHKYDMGSRPQAQGDCWPGLVVDALDCNLAPYGFGGRSWWYSWQRFWRDWKDRLDELEAVVFCHTDFMRMNNAVYDDLPHVARWTQREIEVSSIYQAVELWHRHLVDEDFQRWCHQQFLRNLGNLMPDIKMVHFFSITFPSEETMAVLPGVKFATPLVVFSGAEDSIMPGRGPQKDLRANHFNDNNNRILASAVIDVLNDYEPGIRDLDWKVFSLASSKSFKKYLKYCRQQSNRQI